MLNSAVFPINSSLFIYIIIKIKFKLTILIKFIIKLLINIMLITCLHFINSRLHYYLTSYTKTVYYSEKTVVYKFIYLIYNYFRIK